MTQIRTTRTEKTPRYGAIVIFVLVYLGALAFVLAPNGTFSVPGGVVIAGAAD
jgi:hypothetical protein